MKRLSLLFFLFSAMTLVAQTDRGTITGTVTDSSRRRVEGAKVVVKSNTTGVETLSKTDDAGIYAVTSLSTGNYQVTIQGSGFETFRFDNVSLDVGQIRTLDAKLSVAGTTTQIEVHDPDSGLAKSSVEIGGVVHGSQAQDLSLNGRSFVNLVSLIPGAINSGEGAQEDMRFAGLSDEDNTWHLDGVDNSGINHSYQKVDLHLQVSTEAIAEFRGNSVAYSADQGGSVGGQVEVVSKTGGDQFHGAAWEFLRNNVFDAAPWGSNGILPPLRRNNFGANLGGPILKNKLFFFANYEAVRQNLTEVLTATVPSASFRAQVAAQQPVLAPLVDAYPLGTVYISPQAMTWYGSGPSVTDENSGLLRVDYHVNDKMNAFARYNTDHYTQVAPDGFNPYTAFTDLTTPNIVIGLQNTFSPRFLNDFRYGANRAQFLQGQYTPFQFALQISPFTGLDTPSGSTRNDNSFSWVDDATFLHGRHTIKAGLTIRRVQENKASPSSPDQTLEYTNTTTFLQNLIDSDSYAGAVPVTGQRLTEFFGYVLDQVQVNPTLNLNIGLRYENFGVDHEVEGRGINVDPINCPNVICSPSTPWYYPSNLEFSPRVGVIWSPAALKGKTSIRAGFGIFDGFGQFGGLGQPVGNLATKYTLTQAQAPGFGYPVPPNLGVATYSSSPAGGSIHRKITSVPEWTLSVQQEVAKRTVLQVAYFGTRGTHIFSDITLNGINPVTGKRPYAGYSTIPYQDTSNDAYTEAAQVSVHRNMSNGLMLSANYEFSHSINDGGIGGGEADTPENVNCIPCERAPSDQDMRHYLSASAIWQLPVGRGRTFLGNASRATDFLLGGWQLSGVGTARSGLPLNVTISRSTSALPDQLNSSQRPNRVPGVPFYPEHKTPQDWLNPAAFAVPANETWGDLGRNAVRAPGLWQIDPGLNKRFPVTERIGVNLRAEAFNVFNRAQYGSPTVNWAPPSGGVDNPNNFGVITSSFNSNTAGAGTPRELEFSVKVEF
jgi:Carboxypeptidase regulatory-like domain